MPSHHEMSKSDSSRIQSSQQTGGRDMSSGGFASRAQSAGDRNSNFNSGSGSGSYGGGAKTYGGSGAQEQGQGSAKK